jgi:hypothetical protein
MDTSSQSFDRPLPPQIDALTAVAPVVVNYGDGRRQDMIGGHRKKACRVNPLGAISRHRCRGKVLNGHAPY